MLLLVIQRRLRESSTIKFGVLVGEALLTPNIAAHVPSLRSPQKDLVGIGRGRMVAPDVGVREWLYNGNSCRHKLAFCRVRSPNPLRDKSTNLYALNFRKVVSGDSPDLGILSRAQWPI